MPLARSPPRRPVNLPSEAAEARKAEASVARSSPPPSSSSSTDFLPTWRPIVDSNPATDSPDASQATDITDSQEQTPMSPLDIGTLIQESLGKIKDNLTAISTKVYEGTYLSRVNKDRINSTALGSIKEVENIQTLLGTLLSLPSPLARPDTTLETTIRTDQTDASVATEIETLKSDIAEIKALLTSRPKTTYAAAAAATRKPATTLDTNFTPANVKYVSNNKIRVEFDTQQELDTAIEKVNKPTSSVSAVIARKLNPMFILKGISNSTPVEELTDIITTQNDCVKEATTPDATTGDIKFAFKRGNRNPRLYNAVFTASLACTNPSSTPTTLTSITSGYTWKRTPRFSNASTVTSTETAHTKQTLARPNATIAPNGNPQPTPPSNPPTRTAPHPPRALRWYE
ncbi:uncharacterized protein LOC128201754 [Galleria mellonella]|uniref:Uncharacterized protein LOC128201754 n=1 Tax=Galleria mellonella TaxID=7137 RepID=A0ABM3MW47_GALME|nr:uncharacterized protein LOC128201754 [Galleria mellonella]